MKISLRWLCDHLVAQWTDIDVNKLVADFNIKTAEIEKVLHYKLDITDFTLGKVTESTAESVLIDLPEWKKSVTLSVRTNVVVGQWYLIRKNKDAYSWVSYTDMQSEHQKLLGAFAIAEVDVVSGAWRDQIETEDYIFEVDNKSITHRPDMWGHRGFAREVAALLNVAMIKESDLLAQIPISSVKNPITCAIQAPACMGFSAVYIENLKYTSVLKMSTRLIRIDSKHHDFTVDATNYVMFDLGHPMHAFDADKIKNHMLTVRMASQDEELVLLDETVLMLTNRDIVIADGKKALSLAGIKGGKDSGITVDTKNVLVEAACFDAATVRLSSMRHKIRTDGSARFEKSLDPHNAARAIGRYVQLLADYAVPYSGLSSMVELGKKSEPVVLEINQRYIEDRLGVQLPEGFVEQTLKRLDFGVVVQKNEQEIFYIITVPTFRATKDVAIKEDIVEEVGRFFGYTAIPMELPHCTQKLGGLTWFDRVLRLKEFLAQQACMHEVQNYAFFDNDFIAKIQWTIANPVLLKNPLSEQRTMMVMSLIPHLLQNVATNMANNDSLAFFEWARQWKNKNSTIIEEQVFAGIWYERKKELDFYACKEHMIGLFEVLDCVVEWQPLQEPTQWSSMHQVAQLVHNGKVIGKAGKVSKLLLHHLGGGDAFVFELDGDFIKQYVAAQHVLKPLAKYQATSLDVTVIVPVAVTVAQLTALIAGADKRIFDVCLQDTFVKDEWNDRKSITMRFFVRDETKTMDKQEIEDVYQNAIAKLQPLTIQ